MESPFHNPAYPHSALTGGIIASAMEVHRALGPGLLESAYSTCLAHELRFRGIAFSRETPVSPRYKELEVPNAYRTDFLVEGKVVVEVKAVERIERVHLSQLLTYLRLQQLEVGLLLNFNVPILKEGVRRVVHRPTVAAGAPAIPP